MSFEETKTTGPRFVCPAAGFWERPAHVLELNYGAAVVVTDGLDPDRDAQPAGRRHILQESAVTQLFESHHRDEAPFLAAEQGKHLGAVVPVRKQVIVRELQEGCGRP